MARPGISTVLVVAVVVVLLAVAAGVYFFLPRTANTTTTSSSPHSTSSSQSSVESSTSSSQAIVCTQSQTATGNVTVTISDFAFTPANISIKAGESVQWFYNPSGHSEHEVVSDAGLFQSNGITPGTKFTCTFNQVGTFAYHCMFHPTLMRGEVAVT